MTTIRAIATALLVSVAMPAFGGALAATDAVAATDPAQDPKKGNPAKACDVIVTVEQAAAIQTEIEAAVAAIQPSDPEAATMLANAATAIVAKYGAVTPACPCSDTMVSYVTTALIQQARAAGFADATLRRASSLLTAQIARDLSYAEACVAAAVGTGEDEGTAAIDGNGEGPTVDRNLPPSILDVAPSASGN